MQILTPGAVTLDKVADILEECSQEQVTQEKVGGTLVSTVNHPKHGLFYLVQSAFHDKIVMLASASTVAAFA